jgi:hypothetical protein
MYTCMYTCVYTRTQVVESVQRGIARVTLDGCLATCATAVYVCQGRCVAAVRVVVVVVAQVVFILF